MIPKREAWKVLLTLFFVLVALAGHTNELPLPPEYAWLRPHIELAAYLASLVNASAIQLRRREWTPMERYQQNEKEQTINGR